MMRHRLSGWLRAWGYLLACGGCVAWATTIYARDGDWWSLAALGSAVASLAVMVWTWLAERWPLPPPAPAPVPRPVAPVRIGVVWHCADCGRSEILAGTWALPLPALCRRCVLLRDVRLRRDQPVRRN